MNKFSLFILTSVFATGAFAASHTGGAPAEAQMPASPKAQAAAEDKHNAKVHGVDNSAKQPEAQAAGSPKAEGKAERKHKAKPHTGKKNSTDGRQAQDAKKL